MSKVLDPKVMTDFSGNLRKFNDAMKRTSDEIELLLRKPGIDSAGVRERMHQLKSKLGEMSAKWNNISQSFDKEINMSIEEAKKLQSSIESKLDL